MKRRLYQLPLSLPMRTFCSQQSTTDIFGQVSCLDLTLGIIALIFLMYKFPENYLPGIIGLMIFYALSRLTEFLDHQIFTPKKWLQK